MKRLEAYEKIQICCRLFAVFFKLGIFTIGGGMAMIPLIEDVIVNKKRWMSKDEVVDAIALCQALPGVIAINIATYIGHYKAGFAGALSGTLGILTPSYIIIIIVVNFLKEFQDNPYINGALTGLKAAAAALIFYAAFSIARQVLKKIYAYVIAISAFIAIVFLDVNGIYVIIGGMAIGIFHHLIKGTKAENNGKDVETGDICEKTGDEEDRRI